MLQLLRETVVTFQRDLYRQDHMTLKNIQKFRSQEILSFKLKVYNER